MIVGYTTGVFDLFHIGHVNLLRNARRYCHKLIVGVSTDALSKELKRLPIVNLRDRMNIVWSCKYVDMVVQQVDMNKYTAWKKLKFDVMFVGDDWYGRDNWQHYDKLLEKEGVKIIYFPYTDSTSTTAIIEIIKKHDLERAKND